MIGYRIAITMDFLDEAFGGLFTNGLRQNAVFLYQMFKASPRCRDVKILNMGAADFRFPDRAMGVEPDAVVRFDEVKDDLDVVLVVGTRLGLDQIRYLKERNCRIVFYKGGNVGVMSMEGVTGNSPQLYGERYFDHDWYDLILMTPQHLHTYADWSEVVYKRQTVEVPQIWADGFMHLFKPDLDGRFGYENRREKAQREGRSTWRVGVCDPNITIMKTVHMPALVCDAAWRQQPSMFDKIYLTNSIQHLDKSGFRNFVERLPSVASGVMSLEQRFVLYEFLSEHVDAIVTHHWENGLNYIYYEVLSGNYPLVHNSEFLKDFGYYYESFDADSGAKALQTAFAEHDSCLDFYRRNVSQLMERLSPLSDANIRLHEDIIFNGGS